MTQTKNVTLSLEVARRYDAPPEAVFDAWLTPDWCRWLPPRNVICSMLELEPVEGGRYRVRMTMPDGRTTHIEGEYREISRPDRLVFTWRRENDSQETLITVQLQPEGHGTALSLRQEGFVDAELRSRHEDGWGGQAGSLQKLATFLQAKG